MSDNTIDQAAALDTDTDTGEAADIAGDPKPAAEAVTTAAAESSTAEQVAAADPELTTADPASTAGARVRIPRLATISMPRLGKRSRIAARAAAILVLAASVASSVLLYQRHTADRDLLTAQDEARTAACKYAPVLATYDAKNLDTYFTAVLDGATGDWRKQFDSTSKDLRDVLSQGQVVSKATDVQCAVRDVDKNSAEAIVVIGQTITSLGTQGKPAPGQLSMVMRLERSGDRWLVNKVNSPLAQQPQQ